MSASRAVIALLLASLAVSAQSQHEKKKGEGPPPQSHRGGSSSEERRAAPQSQSKTSRPSEPNTNVRQPSVQTPPPSTQRGESGTQGRRFGQPAERPGRPGDMAPKASGQQGGQGRPTGGPPPNAGQPGNQGRPTGTPAPRFGQPGSQSRQSGQSQQGGNFGPQFRDSRRPGPEVVRTRGGGEIHRGPGGVIREVHTPGGAVIHHAPDGIRRVEVVRPGGRVVVASAHGRGGYVQRPLVIHNTTYIQRTYVYHGVSYARVYRPHVWGGITFHIYTPIRYYRPAFYTWAWTPWPRPVYYRWGWIGSPWYAYYGGWFTPYPYYSSPALWLTDYLIATTLEMAYQERMDAAAAQAAAYSGGQVALTPEVKQAIADEVHRQLEQERAEQASMGQDTSAALFTGGSHVFVVSTPLQVDDGRMGCALTEGDVLRMNGAPPPNASFATVTVLASKGHDCRRDSRVQVALNDLVEMQNQMRANLDQGLNDLQSRQGQEGMPSLPSNATGFTNTSFASEVRPDANASTELSQAAQDADRAEQDVVSQAADSGGTVRITLGMSIAEIEQALGRPTDIADLGSKKIYIYKNMKITFIDGRVSDVQ